MTNKIKIIFFSLCAIFFLGMNVAFAQDDRVKPAAIPCPNNLPCINEQTQQSATETRRFILDVFGSGFLSAFLGLAAAASVVFIIVGGIQMHLAFGNEEALGKAKKTVIWAVVGLVVCILSVTIVQIITKIPL